MPSVAAQALAGGTLLAPRTFDSSVQLWPQKADDPSVVESWIIQTMPHACPLPPVSSQFSHPPLLPESRHVASFPPLR